MADLYSSDITNETTYPTKTMLKDIRALIATGEREGPLIDYKSAISVKDNWPQAIAAFANSFGGIIIFGVEGKGDQARELVGYDPKDVETSTKLMNTILSRIQPRPDIQIRVLTLDTDATREVAVVRVAEGTHPPYMHSYEDEHRVYLRSGARKVEADYLQLGALFERRVRASPPMQVEAAQLHQQLAIKDITGEAQPNEPWYRFIFTPESHGAARRITATVEEEFEQCLDRFASSFGGPDISREQHLTTFRIARDKTSEIIFALTSDGTIGCATHACTRTSDGLTFSPWEFCADIITFLSIATMYSEKSRYWGEYHITTNVNIEKAQVLNTKQFRGRLILEPLFRPVPIPFKLNFGTQTRVKLHPVSGEHIRKALESIANDTARAAGTLLHPSFDRFANTFIEEALKTLARR